MRWRRATVVEIITETARATSIVLELTDPMVYRSGQHVDVRLATPDGYVRQRSYWIASAPQDGYLVLTVQRVPGGQMSSSLMDGLRVGYALEVRGPLGQDFVWDQRSPGPALLVAGGMGIVPVRSMLRDRVAAGGGLGLRLLYSCRSLPEAIYRDELMRLAAYEEVEVRVTLTRERPELWSGYRGRITAAMIADISWPHTDAPYFYVSGSQAFVGAAIDALLASGHSAHRVRQATFTG
jgi:ferredoxin-NADP reductase